jgi:hypothetical protein
MCGPPFAQIATVATTFGLRLTRSHLSRKSIFQKRAGNVTNKKLESLFKAFMVKP